MEPSKKKQKLCRCGDKVIITNTDIMIGVPGDSDTDNSPDAQTSATTRDGTHQVLTKGMTGLHETQANTSGTHKNAIQNVAQTIPEEQSHLLLPQDMSYCTLCGGPLPVKTFHPSIHPLTGLFYAWTGATSELNPWLYSKTYLAVKLEHLRANPNFVPEGTRQLMMVTEQHENFSKYEDVRRLILVSSNMAKPSRVQARKRLFDTVYQRENQKQRFELRHNNDTPMLGVPKMTGDHNVIQNDSAVNELYGGYPMHEGCKKVLFHYLAAVFHQNMKMEGVASWLHCHRGLQAHWNPQQKEYPLAHEYPHGYFGAAEFQGKGWKRVTASEVYEASPTDDALTTAYLLSKLRPLPNDVIAGTEQEHNAMILPCHPTASGAYTIPVNRRDIQWPLLQNTPLDIPPRLIAFVRDKVNGLHNPPLERSVPNFLPEYWLEVLLRGFLWLWDLDHVQCRRKDRETYDDGRKIHWDWEKLVRHLAQDDVFFSAEGLKDAPNGLGNRRRIWRCLDEMRAT